MRRTWSPVLLGVMIGAVPIGLLLMASVWLRQLSAESPSPVSPPSSPSSAMASIPSGASVISASSSTTVRERPPAVADVPAATAWARGLALVHRLGLSAQANTPEQADPGPIATEAEEKSDREAAQVEIGAEEAGAPSAKEGQLGRAVPAEVRRWEEPIGRAASQHGLDPNAIAALMMTESGGNPDAVSPKGAIGLMQVMGGSFDPETSIQDGARILAGHLARFRTLELALAAYNAGSGAVERYGGVPPYRETRDLVFRVMVRLQLYSRP